MDSLKNQDLNLLQLDGLHQKSRFKSLQLDGLHQKSRFKSLQLDGLH